VTRLLVLLSGAIASCYESQWLYPVLMAVGGLSTFGWDTTAPWRERVAGRWRSQRARRRRGRAGEADEPHDAIELEGGPVNPTTTTTTTSPAAAGGVDTSSATRQASTESVTPADANDDDDGDEKKEAFPPGRSPLTAAADGVPSLGSTAIASRAPSLRPTVAADEVEEEEHGEEEDEEEHAPSLYFKLGVKGGLALCVFPSPFTPPSRPSLSFPFSLAIGNRP